MERKNINDMVKALNALADEIKSPDDVPQLCLREAAEMIQSLRDAVADAMVNKEGVLASSLLWVTKEDLCRALERVGENCTPFDSEDFMRLLMNCDKCGLDLSETLGYICGDSECPCGLAGPQC